MAKLLHDPITVVVRINYLRGLLGVEVFKWYASFEIELTLLQKSGTEDIIRTSS